MGCIAVRGEYLFAAEGAGGMRVYDIASIYAVQDVIRPDQTRDYLIRMLAVHQLRQTHGVGKHLLSSWPTSF